MMEFEAGTKIGFSSSKDHDERIAGAVSGGNEHISDVFPWHIRNLAAGFDGNLAMPPCLITPRPACSTPIGWTSWELVR